MVLCFYIVKYIGNGVTDCTGFSFSIYTKLERLIIGNSITRIYSLRGLKGIKEIIIPENVTSIGSYAFSGWTDSQTIYIEAEEVPSGWDENWNKNCNAKIVYGYTAE